jgi:hypothetical protein
MRTEPVRLDHALERVRKSERAKTSRAQLQRFEPVWRDPTPIEEGEADRDGLVDEIFEFIMPVLENPTLFEGSRYLGLLEELTDDLGDPEECDDQVDKLGSLVLRHEVKKHRLLWKYLNSLVDS